MRTAADTAAGTSGGDASSTRPAIAVIIPAYNEEGAVRSTVDTVRSVLDSADVDHQIFVVDDGSTDETSVEARLSGARVVSFRDNHGYGHALKAGIAGSDSDLVAILDADGTYPPDALPAMIQMVANADMVVGDRGAAMQNVPFIRRPAKWVLTRLASLLALRRISDVNSGLRVFRRAPLERFVPLLPDGFSFTTTITLCMLASNLRVVYHPIRYGKRVGHSKIRASHFFKFMYLVLRLTLYFQPLRIFVPLGAVLFVAGLAKTIHDIGVADATAAGIVGIIAAVVVWSLGLLADIWARVRLRSHGSGATSGTVRP